MNYDQLSRISRWKAYFGSSIFVTATGLLFIEKVTIESIIYIMLANFFSMVFSFIINDVEDAEMDRLDPEKRKRNPVSSGEISIDKANFLSLLTAVISGYFYMLLGLHTFLLGLSGIVIGYVYSYKRIRLKAVPVIDILSHGIFLGTVQLITVFSLEAKFDYVSVLPLLLVVNVFLSSILVELRNEIRDIKVDKANNIVNTVIYLNLHRYELLIKIAYAINLTILGILIFSQVQFQATILHFSLLIIVPAIFIYNYLRRSSLAPSYFHNQQILAVLGLFLMV